MSIWKQQCPFCNRNVRFEIATIIRQLYKKLPEKVSYPTISTNKPNDDKNERAFLSYSINAPQAPFAIQETVKNQIEPIIGAIQGVDKTQVYGATPKEFIINYNLNSNSNEKPRGTRLKTFCFRNCTVLSLFEKNVLVI